MSYSLVIVESPAKCQKIQGFLGPGWKVIATMGHIRALEETLDAVGIDRDFEPRYQFQKEKAKAIAGIRESAKSAKTIYLASDDDREGEAISFSVAVLLGLDISKTPRAVFHEITKTAVTQAIQNPRRIDMNRVDAQQARAVLDMLVGFTISPLLWKYVGPALSAGRCQTPALRLLVDREKEISGFQVKTSMIVSGNWCSTIGKKQIQFSAKLFDELEDEESALNYLENIHSDTEGIITSTKTVPRTESPPKPLITSTLQQEASALYGIQPKTTMKSAQRLYESGYITYMRTDSAILSQEAVQEAQKWVLAAFGKEYIGSVAQGQQTKKVENAQEAHEAIRPTHISTEQLPDTEDWSPLEKKIYRLIWQRTVQSTMSPAKHEEHLVLFKANADPDEFQWQSVWKRTIFPGWRAIGLSSVNLDSDSDDKTTDGLWSLVTKLKEGDKVNWIDLKAEPHETRAPGRYTEATLVRELEKKGIGRPSTFASLVGTVLEKEYAKKEDIQAKEITIKSHHIQKQGQWPPQEISTKKKVGAEKQKLVPSALGISVHDFCIREFPHLFDYSFTKKMEERLDAIAEGDEQWKQVCRDTWTSYKEKYNTLKSAKGEQVKAAKERILSPNMKVIQTKKGPFILRDDKFIGWPQGVKFEEITVEQAELFCNTNHKEELLGEYEGNLLLKKKGPYGWYVECGKHRVPFEIGDTVEKIIEKLKAKGDAFQHTIGPYEFKKGPYGVYMYKREAAGSKKKPAFVSIPEGLDPKVLTEEAAARIYKTGLETKKKWKK